MSLLIYSGLLYLFGISIILTLKPELMFSKEGIWKEFGLGRANRTWMPFWLFAIAWAILSYLIVLVIMGKHECAGKLCHFRIQYTDGTRKCIDESNGTPHKETCIGRRHEDGILYIRCQ